MLEFFGPTGEYYTSFSIQIAGIAQSRSNIDAFIFLHGLHAPAQGHRHPAVAGVEAVHRVEGLPIGNALDPGETPRIHALHDEGPSRGFSACRRKRPIAEILVARVGRRVGMASDDNRVWHFVDVVIR